MMEPAPRRPLATIACVAALLALAVLPYLGITRNGFAWDDRDTVVENEDVHDLANLGRVLTTPDLTPPYFRPLTRAVFAVEWAIFGADAAAFHAVSVALHALVVLLLYALGRSLFGRDAPALLLAGPFAVHPVHVEAVAFVSANNNVLATLFVVLTLLAARRARSGLRDPWTWVSAAMALAALASKETGIVALLLVPMLGTVPAPATWRERFRPWARWLPWLAALAIYFLWRTVSLGGVLGTPRSYGSPPSGAFVALWSFGKALQMSVWPAGLTTLHPVPAATAGAVVAAAVPTFAVGVLAAYFARRRLLVALSGLIWFVAALAPSLGTVGIPSVAFAERYLYLALPGLLLVAADRIPWARVRSARPPARVALGVVLAALLASWAAQTNRRVRDWEDNRTLFESALAVAPHPTAHFNLGNWFKNHRDMPRAIQEWERAVALDPDDADAWTQLGVAAAIRGELARAQEYLERALAANPNHPGARANLARVKEDLAQRRTPR